ncbi:hypothetical protein CNEO4_1760048 [Clostridium neonatale]|nr:hypothetical protein CNEO2_1260021 [Clostridium neonatale]CAI3639226.1 hypothetical protein CNEO4_1760048 [Clostridium neonatale]
MWRILNTSVKKDVIITCTIPNNLRIEKNKKIETMMVGSELIHLCLIIINLLEYPVIETLLL